MAALRGLTEQAAVLQELVTAAPILRVPAQEQAAFLGARLPRLDRMAAAAAAAAELLPHNNTRLVAATDLL
jgi:hypothetical protein